MSNTEFNRSMYKRTERRLYDHYKMVRKVERLRRSYSKTVERIKAIQEDMLECKHEIDSPLRAIGYSDMPTGTSTEKSEIERSLMISFERLQREHSRLRDNASSLKETINRNEENIEELGLIIESMTEEQQELMTLKYKKEMRHREIGNEMGLDHSGISRRKDKIVEVIASELLG